MQDLSNNNMKLFKSLDQYFIKGRGTVYMVHNPEEFKNGECSLLNTNVEIDGKIYKVVGIEANSLSIIQKDHIIGLLVEQ